MDHYLILGLFAAVLYFGFAVLGRLPKQSTHSDFTFELPDERVTFRAEVVIEDDFKIGFVDGWEVGRSFSVYGPTIDTGHESGELDFGDRSGVRVGLTREWFKSSFFGTIRGRESWISLPVELGNRMLDELRRDPNQLVTIWAKKAQDKEKTIYRIFSIELSAPPA